MIETALFSTDLLTRASTLLCSTVHNIISARTPNTGQFETTHQPYSVRSTCSATVIAEHRCSVTHTTSLYGMNAGKGKRTLQYACSDK